MFLVTSIAMLRERTTGTFERLMTLPLGKADILFGYGLAFGLLAALQAVVVCIVGFVMLGLASSARRVARRICLADRAMPCSAWRSGSSSAPLRAPSFKLSSSCPRSSCRRSSSAASSCRREPDGRLATRALLGAAAHLRLRSAGASDATRRRSTARWPADVVAVIAFTIAALGLGSLTLQRRTG